MREFKVERTDRKIEQRIHTKIDNLNKPKGSLGRLESLALQICLIEQKLTPTLHRPCHLLFGADHGIEREGVSVSPREITWQQMINFTRGGGGVNMFCKQHKFNLKLIDMGIDYDLSGYPEIINRKIARGTRDFLHEAAMSQEQFEQTIDTGAKFAEDCFNDGSDIISIGEMGIGNTSPSSIWMSLLGPVELKECVGAGAGLDNEGITHKYHVLKESINNFRVKYPDADTETVIRYFGGFEMVAAIGAMLRAAELHLIILVDGFIMAACMFAAYKLYPDILDYTIFCHCGGEGANKHLIQLMKGDEPALLDLGMRLGEGTGAICAFPIIDSAARMMKDMNNFKDANITKYF